jgi:hypothetical protein
MLKNSRMLAFEKITKYVWTKAEERVVKIEKEYCKENCIDRSVIGVERGFLLLHVRVN